ncbi:hypothetical protein N7501_011792 [Penicillium viridicatum]|nr:hypothetical protein N7501_011792 [Penicillium viridicatum]
MTDSAIPITAGPYQFLAKLESAAPNTVKLFRGEGMWIPLGETNFNIPFENHTAHPAPGQILLYPGGISETECLFCYGGVAFASKMGALAANHFLTITEGSENLHALGNLTLWEGAQDVLFELADEDKIRQFRAGRSVKL